MAELVVREYEHMSLEQLSQELEEICKKNEQKRRENNLFESYLLRQKRDEESEESSELIEKGKKKKKAPTHQEKKELNAEEKYEIAQAELESLRKNIEEGRKKSEELLETLRAVLEETDLAIAEIKREAYEFKRDIVMGSENAKTGKVVAERIIRYMEEKMRQKEALRDKFELKNAALNNHIGKANQQIKQKASMGDDLKFIDFHQLQIENKKHVNDINERNKKLLSLKMTTGKTVQRLNALKKKQNEVTSTRDKLSERIESANEQKKKTQEEIIKVSAELKKIKDEIQIQTQKQDMLDETSNVMDYVNQKEALRKKQSELENWKRKVEIAQQAYKRAVTILRQNGERV